MYEPFYGFAEKPFNLTPDPKYLFLSQRHTEATSSFKKYIWVRLRLRDVISSDDWSA